LAIGNIPPFKKLYDTYAGKRLPAHEVIRDALVESGFEVADPKECIDIFVVNLKDIGLLRTIAGAETVIPINQAMDEAGAPTSQEEKERAPHPDGHAPTSAIQFNKTCFYISPIGEEGSDARKHSDFFLESLIVPAMKEVGLTVVRADHIADPGMITTSILDHVRRARLVIADLSMLNPNVFYEMAIRHACKLPIVQIIRKGDRLPFDVGQVKSVVVDDTDIYTLVPKIETYRSEIATLSWFSVKWKRR